MAITITRGRFLLLLFTVFLARLCVISVAGECVDVVRDCGAKPDDVTDSTEAFTACVHLAPKQSGCITVPAGPYRLTQVVLNVSNVDIRVSNDAVLRPWKDPTGTSSNSAFFVFGNEVASSADYVENVSLHGEAPGRFTVDVSTALYPGVKWKAQAASLHGGIKGFRIANMHCYMANPMRNPDALNKSSKSCISSNYDSFNGVRLNPQDGFLENISCKDCTTGYGLIQVRSGESITFRNFYSDGGATLRLETGDGPFGYVGDIVAENMTCKDGFTAVTASPHVQQNGVFHIKDVTSLGCNAAVIVQAGFSQEGYPPAYFSNSSTITNVVGVYGTHAQNSTGDSVPSCTVCRGTTFGEGPSPHIYNVTVTNVTAVGFPQPSDRTQCIYVNRHKGGCPYEHEK